MGLNEEIEKMLEDGKSEQETIIILQQKGYGIKDISESLAQLRIKQAVSPKTANVQEMENDSDSSTYNQEAVQVTQGPEVQAQQSVPQSSVERYQQFQQQYSANQQPQEFYQDQYQQYETGQYGSNSDVISEIAEQVVTEKLANLKNSLEAVYDLKNTIETRIESFDERIKRIEKIIDRLQLSVLQKVGDYLTNVEDIKKELIETQKTFKSMWNKNQNQG